MGLVNSWLYNIVDSYFSMGLGCCIILYLTDGNVCACTSLSRFAENNAPSLEFEFVSFSREEEVKAMR